MATRVCKCKRCGAEWTPRLVGRKPVQCPRCKRVDWDRDTVKTQESDASLIDGYRAAKSH